MVLICNERDVFTKLLASADQDRTFRCFVGVRLCVQETFCSHLVWFGLQKGYVHSRLSIVLTSLIEIWDEEGSCLGEASNLIFGKNWDFVPTEGGGVCQSKILFKIFQGCFCCNMAGVPQSQPTKSPKIT